MEYFYFFFLSNKMPERIIRKGVTLLLKASQKQLNDETEKYQQNIVNIVIL